jgi:hypothetical protein
MIKAILFNPTILKLIARHVLSGFGVYLIAKGLITSSDWNYLLGAIPIGLAVGYSIWEKRSQIQLDIKNTINPPPTP